MTGIAASIRETLTHYRQHEVVSTWMSVVSHLMLAAAKSGKSFYYPPSTEIMPVNSMVACVIRCLSCLDFDLRTD